MEKVRRVSSNFYSKKFENSLDFNRGLWYNSSVNKGGDRRRKGNLHMNSNFLANLHANMGALRAKMVVLREQAERADDVADRLWKRVQELEACNRQGA